MMKRSKKAAVLAAGLALALLCAFSALAAGGDQSDPLVTLSYLNQTAIPQIVSQVEQSMAARQAELTKLFDEKIAQYKQDSASAGGGSGGASFTLLTLSKGQALKPEIGCEMLLRVGSVTVSADGNPALIDVSTGGTINKGGSLEKNHLYMATLSDRTLQAVTDNVKILVRGGYTVA